MLNTEPRTADKGFHQIVLGGVLSCPHFEGNITQGSVLDEFFEMKIHASISGNDNFIYLTTQNTSFKQYTVERVHIIRKIPYNPNFVSLDLKFVLSALLSLYLLQIYKIISSSGLSVCLSAAVSLLIFIFSYLAILLS